MSSAWLSRTVLHPIMSEPADPSGKSGCAFVEGVGIQHLHPPAVWETGSKGDLMLTH